jgi:glycosyltransferase involved in cell wall biosynthesis
MKINYIIPGIELSGGIRVIFEHTNRLKERGHEVNIFSPLIIRPTVYKLEWKRIKQYIKHNQKKWKNEVEWFDLKIKPNKIPSLHSVTLKVSETIIPDADVVFATSYDTADFVAGLNHSKGKKYYFIQHYEAWDILNNHDCWMKAEKLVENEVNPEKIFRSLTNLNLDNPELLKKKKLVEDTYFLPLTKITISSLLKNLIEEKFHQKVKGPVVNGVNFNKFYKEETLEKKSKGSIKISMPYMKEPYKGATDGIEALKLVHEVYPETEFVLYGSQPLENTPSWIKFYGRLLSDDELRKLYNSSDIFVNPSWAEGFSLPPLEAMACGCAVISTEVGAVKDYSTNGENILTSPPKNPRLLAENIIQLIEDDSLREKIANNGNHHVQKFTWNNSVDTLERILQNSASSDDGV